MNIGVLYGDDDLLGRSFFRRQVSRASSAVRGVTSAVLSTATKLPVVGQFAQMTRSGLGNVQNLMNKIVPPMKTDGTPSSMEPPPTSMAAMPLIIGAVVIGAMVMGGKKGRRR